MDIVLKNIEDLLPANYNPRQNIQPGDKEYEKLKKSIEEFGYVDPVIWNEQTGNIVGGHQRLKVLQGLGHNEVQVSVINIDDTKEKALNIALNKISGDWDTSKLSDLLTELNDLDIDMDLTGFDTSEMDDLIGIGLDSIDTSDEFSLPDGDKPPFQQITFTLADEQAEIIKEAVSDIKQTDTFKYIETFGNENGNGNALYCLVQEWLSGHS